jgi:4-hydroxy-tetrahydrodipicolinate synthase
MAVEFEGIYAVIPTPFTDEEEVAELALRRLLDDLVGQGVQGIICNGSTGEVTSLSEAERRQVMEITLEQVAGRVPVLVGASANATRDVIRYSRAAQEAGAAGVMIVHPYYCLPSERELDGHYRDVAQSIDIPIMIYNNPWTTGVDMKPEQLARLAEAEPNIRYVKESSGDAARVGQILARTDRLTVFSGWDNLALEHFFAGARGWVAGSANVIPAECVELFRAVQRGDWDTARQVYRRIYELLTLVETSGQFVQLVKAGLAERGLPVGPPRRPLLLPEGEQRAQLREMLKQLRGTASVA